jgi:hypothetical protein
MLAVVHSGQRTSSSPTSLGATMHTLRPLLVLLLCCCSRPLPAAETQLFVAPSGNDTAAGSREAPLASLTGARDRIRQLRSQGVGGLVMVAFASGTYAFTAPVSFSKQDSGTADGPVTYMAAAGQPVRFTAGRTVSDWQPRDAEPCRPHR